jgi:hypothetical protein
VALAAVRCDVPRIPCVGSWGISLFDVLSAAFVAGNNPFSKGNFMFAKLYTDETGFVFSLEIILVAVILLIGIVTGLSAVRNAVLGELDELADAILAINQSYSVGGSSEQCANTGVTTFNDLPGLAQVTLCTSGQ